MERKKIQKYTIDSIPVNQNGQAVEAECMDLLFINYGSNDLIVNNSLRVPAAPAGGFNFIVISANSNEMDVTKYVCRFVAPGAQIANDAVIVRRNYKS